MEINMDLSPVQSDESPDKNKNSNKKNENEDNKRQLKTEGSKRTNIRGATEPTRNLPLRDKKK